jgi:hypothetical protein
MNPVEMLDIDGNVSISGITRIANTSQSALVVNGGVGIKKNLNVDENINIDKNLIVEDSATLNKDALLLTILNVAGNTNIQSNIIFSNTTDNNLLFGNNGAVIVSGGVGIGGNVTIDKNLRVRSNLMIGNASLIISEDSIGGTDDIIINSKLILNQSIKIANSISTYSSVNNIINTTKSIGILDRQQGTVLWAANISSSGNDVGQGICSDNLGGIYVTGSFSSNVTFYHENGVIGNTKIHSGNGDCFIAKYNNSGTVQWAANISGIGSEIGRSICSDNLGGIYVTGEFTSSTVNFYHANGVVGNTKIHSGNGDCFIAKYNNSGTIQWAANISGSGSEIGRSICSDNLGGIYVTGEFTSSTVTFYHANGVVGTTKIHSGSNDCFIAKYNNSGTVQWAANISGSGSEIGRSICSDNLGGIYVTGEFTSSTVTFYHANGVVGTTKIHSGGGDCFIAKYNNSGTVQWAANISGSGSEIGRSICSDNLGGIYVTGEFASSTVTFYHANGVVGTTKTNSGSGDCFIAKYNNSGTVQWAANISGSGSEIGLSICSDNLDGIYAIGFFNGSSVTFYHADSVVGTTKINRNNIGIYTCFIAKYNNSGIVQWVADIGSSSILGRSICSDNLGRIYITGQYGSSITFYNANGSSSGITKINSGGDDCYIACYQDAYYLPNLTTNENGITIKTLNVSGGITNVINNISTSIQSNKAVDFLWYNNRWFTK